jgi:Zn-dependent peptidase ImmA (M78 family)
VSFPKKVKVGHVRYTLREEKGLASIAEASGTCGEDTQLILIDDQIGPDQQRDTVLHELLHALFYAMNAKAILPKEEGSDSKELEEKIIFSLATRLLELLRDNPKLVGYLLEG